MVKVILDSAEIPQDKKVIIDFFATWCGPCQRIAPCFNELSEMYPSVDFIKVDVDQGEDIAEKMDISSLPTFIFMENGSVINKLESGDSKKLTEMMKDFAKKEEKEKEENVVEDTSNKEDMKDDSNKENIDPNKQV